MPGLVFCKACWIHDIKITNSKTYNVNSDFQRQVKAVHDFSCQVNNHHDKNVRHGGGVSQWLCALCQRSACVHCKQNCQNNNQLKLKAWRIKGTWESITCASHNWSFS